MVGTAQSRLHTRAISQVNLVSDLPGIASIVDKKLVNPLGLAIGPTSPIWSANNGTDTATLYCSAPGSGAASIVVLVVSPPGVPPFRSSCRPARVINGSGTHVGKGLGFVDAYTPGGRLVDRVASRHTPNAAPWGLEIAPPTWGKLAGDLLVGNFGDGKINVLEAERHNHSDGGHARFESEFEWLLRNAATGKTLVIRGCGRCCAAPTPPMVQAATRSVSAQA